MMKEDDSAERSYWFLKKIPFGILFVFLGGFSTLWFLIRVIPKPSRAGYPCMRAAAPLMSAFFLYLLSITSSVYFFRRAVKMIAGKYYYGAGALLMVVIGFVYLAGSIYQRPAVATQSIIEKSLAPNEPVGNPQGLLPGRVVWVWDSAATNKSCTNTAGDYWFQNTNQDVVDSMLQKGICNLAGNSEAEQSWDDLFRHFNGIHGKGEVGYTPGEKIYVKLNLTNSCCAINGTTRFGNFERMDATPELVLAILKQLIHIAGVNQSDIYIGDPFRTFRDLYWDLCTAVFPSVNYCDGGGLNGRYKTVPTSNDILVFSDGINDFRIPQEYVDASYIINIACLKSHAAGGITLAAKNHMGSFLQDGAIPEDQSAEDMHYSLPYSDGSNGGHHRYRHLVDFMGHEHLGAKTLLTLVDGIWAGKGWEGWVEKWQMEPFGNDYPNSIFLSQDPVAIESVCWDFLLEEYATKPLAEKYPFITGVEDYLLQAADPSSWAEGIVYDPENDGSPLGSLGVYEHWNNAIDMQYTVIDFVKVFSERLPTLVHPFTTESPDRLSAIVYPNPATEYIFIEYVLRQSVHVRIVIYALSGGQMSVIKNRIENAGSHQLVWNAGHLSAGYYLIKIDTGIQGNISSVTKKIQVI